MVGDPLHLSGSLQLGVESTVSTDEVEIIAANDSRKKLILQVISGDPVRVGPSGVTGSTGFQVASGDGLVVLEAPFCPTHAMSAIQAGGLTDATVFAAEIIG